MNPIIKKIVTSPEFYTPLIIGLCSIPYPDLRTFLTLIDAVAIGIGGSTTHALSATIANIVESGINKLKKKKLEVATETFVLKSKLLIKLLFL